MYLWNITTGRVKEQSSRNSRANLSQKLEGYNTKATYNHTVGREYTTVKYIILQQESRSKILIEKVKREFNRNL